MPREWLGGLEQFSLRVIETSSARAQDKSRVQRGSTSRHMDNTRTREIQGSNAQEWVRIIVTQESIGGPDGMGNDGVDETRQKD